jgi:hypothetical protein
MVPLPVLSRAAACGGAFVFWCCVLCLPSVPGGALVAAVSSGSWWLLSLGVFPISVLPFRPCLWCNRHTDLCTQAVHNNSRPTFKDLNAVAAHSLASLLLPARQRSVASPVAVSDGLCDSVQDPRTAAHGAAHPRLSPGMAAAHANSTAALAQLPATLGRRVVLADMLQQVRRSHQLA